MNPPSMETTVRALLAPAKGILAADESGPTIEKRFKTIGVTSTAAHRRAYREMLFTAPGLGQFISGVILYDETIRQKAADGTPLVELLSQRGMVPGIKVDLGAKPLAGFPGETITEGLDGLRERLAEYAKLGARFTKWRGVFAVDANRPTSGTVEANAQALARFAALSQEAGLVPIVEPEVLMDGGHTIERHEEAMNAVLPRVFAALATQRVNLETMLLKPSMVVPGTDCPVQADPSQIAAATVRCLLRFVPAAVPGIVFLSGGQEDVAATKNLNALNQLDDAPWVLTFSYGRALQSPALEKWGGSPGKVRAGQQALLLRARCNSAARAGKYTAGMELGSKARKS
jgi:fructose-bisphosphate aldolase class I